MKSFILALTIICLFCETLAQSTPRIPHRKRPTTKSPLFEKSIENDSFLAPDTSKELQINETTTTERTMDTTSKNNVRDCPQQSQSSFSKPDLIKIIDIFADQLHILENIRDAYNDTAIRARDEFLQELSDFQAKLKNSPGHLYHILEDMEETREIKIAPLVKIASTTLQEYAVVEIDFKILCNKTMKIIDDIHKSKLICELNNCNESLHNITHLRANSLITTKPEHNGQMCSTIENVHKTVHERLFSFENEEIEILQKHITETNENITEGIADLKARLKDAAINQFGVTMYNVLSLGDEHFHFMKALIDFNSQAHASILKKQNMNIEYLLMELGTKSQDYRRYCLSCGQALRQRRHTTELDVETVETDSEQTIETASEETNIVDNLINDKIIEMKRQSKSNVDDIFKQLIDTLSDNVFFINTIAELVPIQESVSERVEQDKHALQSLMKIVPKNSLDYAQVLFLESQELLHSINNIIDNFFSN